MLFYPLYSVAFCKGCNVRCVHKIIHYLIQGLLSKPVINLQIMKCPLLVCFIWCFDWLLWGTECRKTFLKTTTTTTKIIYRQRNFTRMNYSENWQKLGIYTTDLVSSTQSAPQNEATRWQPPWMNKCVLFLFRNIANHRDFTFGYHIVRIKDIFTHHTWNNLWST